MAERFRIGAVADFSDGKLHTVDAGGTTVVVGMVDGTPYAARNRCPHLGLSLSKGPGPSWHTGPGARVPAGRASPTAR